MPYTRPMDGSGWGAGGPPGLQIRSGGGNVSGGFDSLTLPPCFIPSEAHGKRSKSSADEQEEKPGGSFVRQLDEPALK